MRTFWASMLDWQRGSREIGVGPGSNFLGL